MPFHHLCFSSKHGTTVPRVLSSRKPNDSRWIPDAGPGPAASRNPIEMVTPPSQGHVWSRWLCRTGNLALLSAAKGAKLNFLSSQFRSCVLVTTSLWKAPYRKRNFALNHVLTLAIAIVLHCTTWVQRSHA